MSPKTKDRLIGVASIVIIAAFILLALSAPVSAWLWTPTVVVLALSLRPLGRKLLYNRLDFLERRLRSWYDETREEAAAELGRVGGPRAKAALLGAVEDAAPNVRLAACRALSHLGEECGPRLLLGMLHSDNSYLRKKAAETLAEVGWRPSTSAERIDEWIALGDFAQPVGEGIDLVEALLEGLDRNRDNAAARIDIVRALGRIGGQPVVAPLLETLKNDESAKVRRSAWHTLKGLQDFMTVGQRSDHARLTSRSLPSDSKTVAEIKLVCLFVEKEGTVGGGILDVWKNTNPRAWRGGPSASQKCVGAPILLQGWTAGKRKENLFQHINDYLSGRAQGCHTIVQGIEIHFGRTIPAWLVTFFTVEPDSSPKKVMIITGADVSPDVFAGPSKYSQ